MNIQEQLQQDLKTAMRAGERQRVEVIRMALSALKNAQIAQVKQAYDQAGEEAEVDRSAGLSEAAMQETLTREVKRRREAAEAYRQAQRTDLAEGEEAEATILEAYLPRQLTAEELRPQVAAIIAEIGASSQADIGRVMPTLMARFKGQADGRVLSQLARELLSKS